MNDMAEYSLYRKISDDIRALVLAGEYAPEDMIPSENELAARYATSRLTVRRALQILENDGIITPLRGKGYFVRTPEYSRYTLTFEDNPADSSSKYDEIDVIPAPKATAALLHLADGSLLTVIRRIILREGEAIAYDEKCVPYRRGEPSIERELHYSRFVDIFTDRYVPHALKTEMEITVAPAPVFVCRALRIEAGTRLLCVTRRVCTREGEVVGCGKRWITDAYGGLPAESEQYFDKI